MSNPLISIIIPIFNSSKYLKNCLDSIINQSYKDLEILCIIDGSTDNSIDIIKQYEDSRIVTYSLSKNHGLSYARNYGLDRANGKWILFVDSDDQLNTTNNEISLLVNAGESKTNIDAVFSNTKVIYETQKQLKNADLSYFRNPYNGFKQLSDDDINEISVCVWGRLYKKSSIKKLRFPDGILFEDNYWIPCFLVSNRNIFFINNIIYIYFRHKTGIMAESKNRNNNNDYLILSKAILNYFEQNKLVKKHKQLLLSVINRLLGCIKNASIIEHKEIKNILNKI